MEDYDDNDNQTKGDLLSRPQRKLWLSHRDFYCWLQVGEGDIVPDDIDILILILILIKISILFLMILMILILILISGMMMHHSADALCHHKFQQIKILGDACHQERERHRNCAGRCGG